MNFLLNGIIVCGILGIVYLLTMYSSPIRSLISTTKTAVAGAHTSAQLPHTFPQELEKDIATHVEDVKKSLLEVSVGEVFSFFGRAGKIVEDIRSFQNDAREKVEKVSQ